MILSHRRKAFRSSGVVTEFIISVKTDNAGTSADDQIMLPIQGTNMVIDWGDGSELQTVTQASAPNHTYPVGANVIHTYSTAGTYEIKISNAITRIFVNSGGDKLKITDVSNWGTAAWSTMAYAFRSCENMTITATDVPNFSSCTSIAYMLANCVFASLSCANWDVSTITDANNMFAFNGNINPDVATWNTSALQNFSNMFNRVYSFKRDLSSWDFEAATNLTAMFIVVDINETGTTTNYDALLNSIASQAVNNSLTFSGGTSKYSSAGETARWQLIAVHDSANADASGTDKSTYDDEAAGYQFWHTGESKIYIKKSAASADWTTALNLGKSWTITDGGLA
jgi:hypothetical protein